MGYTVRFTSGKMNIIIQYLPLIMKTKTIITCTMVADKPKSERHQENGERCGISKADAGLGLDAIHILGIYEGGR
jgi:hypothetical protein